MSTATRQHIANLRAQDARRARRKATTTTPVTPQRRQGDRGDPDAAPRQYVTGPQLLLRYGVTSMSLLRWRKDAKIAFPPPAMTINKRNFWLEEALVAWEKAQLPGAKERAKKAGQAA